jgi:hypothetical protein
MKMIEMNDQALAARVAAIAGRIGILGRLPPVARMVSAAEMRAASADPARPAGAKIWASGELRELWWSETNPVTENALIHELSHWLLATSASAPQFPHDDADVDGHGPLFAALAWALAARVGVVSDHPRYDLGDDHKPGDRPADAVEERWARRWARRPHEGTAEALAARAIRDYRRLCQLRAMVAAVMPFLRLAVALAAAMTATAALAHMI